MRSLFAILGLISLTACLGCGGAPSTGAKVGGAVTFQGQPVSQGEIVFTPSVPGAASVAGKIEQGKYACEVPPGKNLVRISAYREVPGKFDMSNPGEQTPVIEMYIPEQYNARSTLEVTIDGNNAALDFPLGKT